MSRRRKASPSPLVQQIEKKQEAKPSKEETKAVESKPEKKGRNGKSKSRSPSIEKKSVEPVLKGRRGKPQKITEAKPKSEGKIKVIISGKKSTSKDQKAQSKSSKKSEDQEEPEKPKKLSIDGEEVAQK